MQRVPRLQAALGGAIRESPNGQGFTKLLRAIIGPASNPEIRGAKPAAIDFCGRFHTVMPSAT